MRKTYVFLILTALTTSGCASYFEALSYKASETGPKAYLNVVNRNEQGLINVFAYLEPECNNTMKILFAPINKGGETFKAINAERPFAFTISGAAGSDTYYVYGCGTTGHFVPRQGKTYELVYQGNTEKCTIKLTEKTESGQRVPVAFQQIPEDGLPKIACK